MRVQHNIMAMGAYRNYTNNVSAMKKNLERLSSGYKINRAGDDAAGLAISEKMRAQITGLETAQKNAKDGISLVQTAEGALTEVHDMLNRMVELATQSANGTYDNTTDRFQLQKEVNQLMDEINRIADSANFNGIQLLDGSMAIRDAVAASSTTNTDLINGMDRIIKTLSASGDKAYQVNGNKTVLDSTTGQATRAVFEIDLSTMKFTTSASIAANGTIGGTISITIGGTTLSIKGSAIKAAGALSTALKANATIDSGYIAAAFRNVIKNATVSNKPEWLNIDTNNGNKKTVTINGVEWEINTANETGKTDSKLKFTQRDIPNTTDEARANFDVRVDIKGRSGDQLKIELVKQKDKAEVLGEYSIKFGTVVKTVGIAKADANKAHTIFEIRDSDIKDGTKIALGSLSLILSIGPNSSVKTSGGTIPTQSGGTAKSGETIVKLDEGDDLFTALCKISKQIGSTFNMYYVDPKTGTQQSATFQIGVNDGTNGGPVGLAIQRVNNYDPKQAAGSKAFAFDTLEKLAQNFKMEVTSTTTTEAKEAGKGLTLQIGDTAENFNQLVVSIEDCHTDAIGIGAISIADQESAALAVDAIKAAINYVSDVRGTLGATQNRLEHTINNLSVMTENIQDAESTIRDTDIAEEMMAYTKNNILIQASQAMLAQANQVPQGVLQLLQ